MDDTAVQTAQPRRKRYAFALALSGDGELSVTASDDILRLTRSQTDAIRSVLLACPM